MRILSVHNHYQQSGGEDRVFANETRLLEDHGHAVVRYEEYNDRISRMGIAAAGSAIGSYHSYRKLKSAVGAEPCDVAHFHNTFPLISPIGYLAMRHSGIPVIQTLHNYRLLCAVATMFREGKPCEDCLTKKSLTPAIAHGCYRGSRFATAAVAGMLAVHRAARTWQRTVDVYIAPSEFARAKFVAGGLPANRIVVKPNFVADDPGPGEGRGGYALYVGRLSEEKGVPLLAEAWRSLSRIPLVIAGEGPLKATAWPEGVTVLGNVGRERIFALMREAHVLILPSACYEVAPMALIEGLACGLPAIASRLGSIPEFICDRRTGLLFAPGDTGDLVSKVRRAFDHPEELHAMRAAARREYEQKYTAERNYRLLIDIYEQAIDQQPREHTYEQPIETGLLN